MFSFSLSEWKLSYKVSYLDFLSKKLLHHMDLKSFFFTTGLREKIQFNSLCSQRMTNNMSFTCAFPALLFLCGIYITASQPENPFWPCRHDLNDTPFFNLSEVLGQWLLVASMDDLSSSKKTLLNCDYVTLNEVNGSHLVMSGSSAHLNQQNMSVIIQNSSMPGKWNLPDIAGSAMIIDLDPGLTFTMAVCYRPLNFWWLAVFMHKREERKENLDVSLTNLTSFSEESKISASPRHIIHDVSHRLLGFGIDIDKAQVLTNPNC